MRWLMGRAVSRRNAGDWVEKRVAAFALPLPLKGFAQFAFYFSGSRGVDGGVCFFFLKGVPGEPGLLGV